MKLVQMKCPSCGAQLKVNSNCNCIKCEFCGITTMIDDEKIVVEHNIKNTALDTIYENAFVYLDKLYKYDEAKNLFLKLSEVKPGDFKIWKGLILAETKHFDTNTEIDDNYFLDYTLLNDAFENYTLTEVNEDDKNNFIEKYNNYVRTMEEKINLIRKEKDIIDNIANSKNNSARGCMWASACVFIFIILFIGVSSSEGDDNVIYEETTSEKIQEYYNHHAYVDCPYFADGVIGLNYDLKMFITKDKLYEYITSGLFSNNHQCREIGHIDEQSKKKIGNFLSFDYKDRKRFIITDKGYFCSIPDLKCEEDNNFKSILAYLDENLEGHNYQFVLRENSSWVYNDEGLLFIPDTQELYYVTNFYYHYITENNFQKIDLIFDEDEKIIHIGKNVVTNKGFYYVEEYTSNYEECNKYVDVPCESKYGLFKLDFLSSLYDELYFVGNHIIDKEGNIYFGNSH